MILELYFSSEICNRKQKTVHYDNINVSAKLIHNII